MLLRIHIYTTVVKAKKTGGGNVEKLWAHTYGGGGIGAPGCCIRYLDEGGGGSC